ncbi:hypothetical protein, conserved [Trypanosoma brucei gambiense DAL972]|uniref:MORN repeat-containing protein n=1 Tax=Trypanosoma brucei gambiense (strain MHOM/CI/86/DAL972) TaxID=679716 RepID=C9ZID0_TRYB9|nr:hypothetical protein, conserved [Trypanosoma brucei gambiense DAL972]CBH08922.1 hypothetical protein, conserved [Trypanosoma brucei gambiense DAL972]|eukprot:XP_011771363.1 hypothetical protein, conserved [Trypanosoma brucei gambiense DAL972]
MLPSSQDQLPSEKTSRTTADAVRRVAAYPIDFNTAQSNTITHQQQQQLKSCAGIDLNLHPLCQQHFYTGEMMRGGEGSRGALIPHGKGTLLWVLYATAPDISFTDPSGSVGLPYELLVREFGEVNTLRDAVLLALCVYSGSFNSGKQWGGGSLTIYPQCVKLDCCWEDGKPMLKRNYCVLYYPASSQAASCGDSAGSNSGRSGGSSDSTASLGTLLRSGLTRAGKAATASTANHQYIGMLTMTTVAGKAQCSLTAGLAWSQHVQFMPDGIGEMCYQGGVRYCGEWKSGRQHGFGVEFDPKGFGSMVYIGRFENNRRCGTGTLYNCKAGVVVSGTWSEGKLCSAVDVGLPSWPFVLRNAQWTNVDEWSFEKASLVHSDTSLNGTWEPLFSDFDSALTDPADLEKEEMLLQKGTNGGGDSDADGGADEWERSSVIVLLRSFLQRKELKATLMLFQRCFYFLYKPCAGGARWLDAEMLTPLRKSKQQQNDGEPATVGSSGASLPVFAKLRDLGRTDCGISFFSDRGRHWCAPSWCNEMGLGSGGGNSTGGDGYVGYGCFHTASTAEGLAARLPPEALFKWAARDLAFVVSSVRLRLLSCIASHPAAGSLVGSRHVLAVCWDTVYSLVAPVMHDLASAVEIKAYLETSMALKRCINLCPSGFVCSTHLSEASSAAVSNDEIQGVIRRCGFVFSSPSRHWRRRATETNNGKLLQFGPYVSNEIDCTSEEAVTYATPSTLLAAFATLRCYADRLFPRNELLRERWMSGSIANAFTKAAEVHPQLAMSPPAVLRVLATLATEVNPAYPFAMEDVLGIDEQRGVMLSSTRIDSGDRDASITDVMSLLLAAHESAVRLRHAYPNIRHVVSYVVSSGSGTHNAHRFDAVYPLDELAVRTRFVLLGVAAEVVQQQHMWFGRLVSRDNVRSGNGECNNSYLYCSDEDVAHPQVMSNDASGDELAQMKERAERVLRLPVWVMQEQISKRCADQHTPVGKGERKLQTQTPSTEVLRWVMKCVGSILELPNVSKVQGQSTQQAKASRQRSLDSSVRVTQDLWQADPVLAVSSECNDEDCGRRESLSDSGLLGQSFKWKHFLPSIPPFTVAAADARRHTVAVELAATQFITGTQPDALLTSGEILNFALIQKLLADVGVTAKLCMRFCYDNEEDSLFSPQLGATRGNGEDLTLSFNSLNAAANEEESDTPASVSCVGREAEFTLHMGSDFIGSLCWDVLADAWMAALTSLRTETMDVQRLAKLTVVRQSDTGDV